MKIKPILIKHNNPLSTSPPRNNTKKRKKGNIYIDLGHKEERPRGEQYVYNPDLNWNEQKERPTDTGSIIDLAGSCEILWVDDESETPIQESNELDKILEVIPKLTKQQQEIIKLLLEGKDYYQIAEILNINRRNVLAAIVGSNRSSGQEGGIIRKIKYYLTPKYIITDPYGVKHKICNLSQFCKENGISDSGRRILSLRGKYKKYRLEVIGV